ncbi:MAG: VOC family protein [Ferruginibacter sp.]
MVPECSATIFHVSNVEMSIKYYTEVLGFTVDFRYKDLAGLEYGTVLIYLSGPGQDVKKTVGEGSVYVFCDEVDQYFRDICIKGAFTEIAIDDKPYGMRDFAIKDPDGNMLSFGMRSVV